MKRLLLPFISKAVIDVGIQTRDLDFINIVLIANIVIIISVTISNAVRDWLLLHITARVNIALISDYLIKLMQLPVTFFENKMIGDILQRAQDHERIRSFIMNNSLNLIRPNFMARHKACAIPGQVAKRVGSIVVKASSAGS